MISRALQITVAILLIAVFGMGVYLLQTKRRAEELELHATDQRPIAPPVAGSENAVTLWIARDTDAALHRETARIALPEEAPERARELLRALFGRYLVANPPHAIGIGGDIKAVYVLPDGLAVIDLNLDFADRHPSGVLVETLTLSSIAQTLIENVPAIKRVQFLVDSKPRSTLAGHADLTGTYELGVLGQAVPKQ